MRWLSFLVSSRDATAMNGRLPVPEPLAYAIASASERRAAALTAFALIAFAAIASPLGSHVLVVGDSVIPATNAAAFVALLVSATIARNQFRTSHFAPFAFLSASFALTAALLVPYTLAFPRAFSPNAFGLGPQVQMWLWVDWHAAFVLGIGAYVWSESFFARRTLDQTRASHVVRTYVSVVVVVWTLITLAIFTNGNALPILITERGTTPIFHSFVEALLLASCAIVFVTLVARTLLRHTTHLWLGVVLVAFAVETYTSGQVAVRHFSAPWYLGLFEGLAWQTIFLTVQLRHSNEQLAAYANDKRSLVEATLHDALTGVYNRRGFDARLKEAIADCQVARAPLAVLVLDLDHFKLYNDYFGHLAGDEALRAVGKALSKIVNRQTDSCCRVGGEEFAIVLAPTNVAGAQMLAERVREAVMRLDIAHAPDASHAVLTVSLGYAIVDPASGIDGVEAYRRADRALYRAKDLGRNRIAIYNVPTPRESGLRAV